MKCSSCDLETYMPFKCPYCEQYFCVEHRLPENHACPESWRARAPRDRSPPLLTGKKGSGSPVFEHKITYAQPGYRGGGVISFSHTELKHLLAGGLLTLAIGLSMPLWWGTDFYASPLPLIVLAFLFAVSFLSHELAHKVAAQQYGLWAEFRITPFGALITLLSTISPFKIISPGTVIVAGVADKDVIGRTAVVGPVTNIVFALAFFVITHLVQVTHVMSYALMYTVMINAFIALFNLLPFGILDGFKVFEWNKLVWLIIFTLSIVLTIYGATSFSLF
ncbi:MAG: hypothetical protein JSV35_04945 [Candidatus Bathyarchaeota archaeon]|nr:MAG: hypothetical protein JSV35_04945 [Candidatus Bathyarchaeota archaeon]